MNALILVSDQSSSDGSAKRFANAIRNLGWCGEIQTAQAGRNHYDLCFLLNLSALTNGDFSRRDLLRQLEAVRCRSTRLVLPLLNECLEPSRVKQACELASAAGVDAIAEIGLSNRARFAARHLKPYYHFLSSGLTEAESKDLDAFRGSKKERTIPWAIVGFKTTSRVRLVHKMITAADPGGFIYLFINESEHKKNAMHLDWHLFHSVLRRTRYQIWCSDFDEPYLETDRFRISLLAGGVPIKVVNSRSKYKATPFAFLIFEESDFTALYHDLDFESLRDRFVREYRQLPTLEQAIARLLKRCFDFGTRSTS